MLFLTNNNGMKGITTGCLLIGIALLVSCSTAVDAPGPDEGLVLVYVEEIHKPVQAPDILLDIEGWENPLRFKVRSPAGSVKIGSPGTFTASGWSASGDVLLSGGESFDFTVTNGGVTLLPYKVMLVGKTQMEIRPLSDLDLEFARSRFAKHPDFGILQITYPDVP